MLSVHPFQREIEISRLVCLKHGCRVLPLCQPRLLPWKRRFNSWNLRSQRNEPKTSVAKTNRYISKYRIFRTSGTRLMDQQSSEKETIKVPGPNIKSLTQQTSQGIGGFYSNTESYKELRVYNLKSIEYLSNDCVVTYCSFSWLRVAHSSLRLQFWNSLYASTKAYRRRSFLCIERILFKLLKGRLYGFYRFARSRRARSVVDKF